MLKKLFSLFAALTLSVGLWAANEFKIVNANGFQQPVNHVAQVISATNTDSCGQIVNFPYYNDFENFAEEQDCWVSIDNDCDGQTWITGTLNYAGAKFGMDASICLISQSFDNNVGAFNADNYLLTPEIVLPANKTVTLSWYAKAQDSGYLDWYEVMVAPNASTEISSFVSVFNEKGASDWTLHTVNLSAYAGTTIRVVFHHKDYDNYFINIDNLGIECETPTTFNVTVPEGTDTCYIVGTMNAWNIDEPIEMTKLDDTHYTYTAEEDLTGVKYKYVHGADWGMVEKAADGSEMGDRVVDAEVMNDTVAMWADATTGLENVKADMKANKIIKNGKMYLRDGKGEWVNILGF